MSKYTHLQACLYYFQLYSNCVCFFVYLLLWELSVSECKYVCVCVFPCWVRCVYTVYRFSNSQFDQFVFTFIRENRRNPIRIKQNKLQFEFEWNESQQQKTKIRNVSPFVLVYFMHPCVIVCLKRKRYSL